MLAIARGANALLVVATVGIVGYLGRRIYGARGRLLAALFLAAMPLAVRFSFLVITDTPAAFWVSLTLLWALRIRQHFTLHNRRGSIMPITLGNDHLCAVIAPETGASVLAFAACRGNVWHPLMPDVRVPNSALPGASFLMIPYSNRIENGEFTFQGKRYRLARGAQHAIHGDVRQRPWKTVECTATQVRCTFDSGQHESLNWPWPFVAQAEYRLEEGRLIAGLALWNRGNAPMPAGGGWHPYFNRTLTTPGEPVELCFRTTAVYPDAKGTRIPSGPPQPLSAAQDFSSVKPLVPDHFFDTCFRGYDGNGYIAWPASGARLRFAASPACSHLVLYNPPDKPFFAVEPVTHANNGVNLLARGDAGCGIVALQPGECLKAWFSLQVEWR